MIMDNLGAINVDQQFDENAQFEAQERDDRGDVFSDDGDGDGDSDDDVHNLDNENDMADHNKSAGFTGRPSFLSQSCHGSRRHLKKCAVSVTFGRSIR